MEKADGNGKVTGFEALRRGLCPACRSGRIFAGRWRMNDPCPVCGTRFERAPGYFVGSMYITYALAAVILTALVAALHFTVLRTWPLERLVIPAALLWVPMVPAVFRWSRILWIHIGHRFEW